VTRAPSGGRELGLGLALLWLAALPTRRGHPPRWEIDCFRAVNDLPDGLYAPVWIVMQLGALGAVPVTAAAALVSGDRALARRLAVGGTTAWVAAKVVKHAVHRARPGLYVGDARTRGNASSGHGFPSGHAGVATALVGAALLSVDTRTRPLLAVVAGTVGAARIYVGAHLPLDVLGGIAVGLVVDGALRGGGVTQAVCGQGGDAPPGAG
jgi:membrane-associated phospholipid phosphatase